jgi:UDP-N-acetylmuramoyl-L-alanyl-D-glutamate--2,6-diaminopimelate ligase
MPGLFNVENALCAITVAWLLDIDPQQIRTGLTRCHVPGRMELINSPDPHVLAIVDYAHNKLSYQRFFSSIKGEFPGRRIIAVLGAPGDKAQERRRELPEEASKWADVLIYTEEDPGHERVEDICAEMLAATPVGQRAEIVCDRPSAISRAVDIAYEQSRPALICLLAKGDETDQHEGDVFVPCETDGSLFLKAMDSHSHCSPDI